jgi:hypothetical protein
MHISLSHIQESLWQCFGNALHWYQAMAAMVTSQVDTWIQNTTTPAAPSEVNTEIYGYAAKELQSKHLRVTVEDHGYSTWDLQFTSNHLELTRCYLTEML